MTANLDRTVNRRRALQLMAAGSAAVMLGACGGDDDDSGESADAGSGGDATTTTEGQTASGTSGTGDCSTMPEETAGPYPGDGSNGPNILTEDGVVRSDIRTSIGSASGTAEGIPTTIKLTVQDSGNNCAPLVGAAVYLWHCDRAGDYSMYSEAADDENYLRGVQVTDNDGAVTFVSIFPACYSGRWPHIHYEIYPSVDKMTDAADKIGTSQLALPEDVCDAAYATEGYDQSVSNLSSLSLETDGIFSDDDGESQLAAVTGSAEDGYTVSLTVAVDPDNPSAGASGGGGGGGVPPGPPPGGGGGTPPGPPPG